MNGESAAVIAVLFVLILVIFVFFMVIAAFAFWIWMLVDCLNRDFKNNSDKIVWVIVFVFLGLFGAAIYYFVVKRNPDNSLESEQSIKNAEPKKEVKVKRKKLQ